VARIFHWGAKTYMAEGQERGVVPWEGQQPPPHQLRGLGERCELPSGVRGGAQTAQRFSTISALRMMASPDTII